MKFSFVFLSLLFIGLSSGALAEQSANEQDMPLETIVVSGTKTPKLLSDSPVSVDVVEGSTINLITKGTLADVLEFIPGVVITRSVKDGYNVMMRGFDSKHVLILVNGQPLASPANSSVDLDQISATDIAQIEIMKGAASVMYGSAAMGGVINIITNRDNENKAIVTYEVGSYLNNAITDNSDGSNEVPLSHTFKLNLGKEVLGWYHSVRLQSMLEAGFDYDSSTARQDAAELDKLFVNYSAFNQLGHLNTTFAYQYFDEFKDKVTAQVGSVLFNYTSDVQQHQFDVNLHDIIDEWKVNARYIDHNELSGQSGSLRDTQIKLVEFDGMQVWQSGVMSPKSAGQSGRETILGFLTHYDYLHQFKLGTGGLAGTIEIDDKSRSSIEAYAQHNYYTKDYQLLIGVRAQEDEDFGFHSAVQIDGMFELGNQRNPMKLRMGFGQGYRVPDLKERHYIFDHSNLGYKVLGNEALVPEQSDTISASLDFRTDIFNDNASYNLEFSTHYSETENLITTVNDKEASALEGLDINRYINLAQAQIQGFDISNELAFQDWTAQLHYSYLESEDQDGQRIEGKPRHQIKANLGYDFEHGVSTMLYLIHQADEVTPSSYSEAAVEGYSIVNFKLNHQLNSQTEWHFSFNNMFDEHQSSSAVSQGQFDPRPVSSREIKLGMTYQF